MVAPALLSLILLILSGQESHCSDKRSPAFGYDGDIGPAHWAKSYDTCAGKFQSPIDIEEHLVDQVRLPPLEFKGFHTFPVTSTLTNNGHTVMLQMERTEEAIVSGGPLKGDYTFAQLHFHWGANDSMGSEDTINNHTFPLELHLVFFKKEYKDFNNAIHYEDGLTVLAVFFEVYGSDNQVYSEIVAYLPKVAAPGATAKLLQPITLESLLPQNKHLYFTYHGSLTTPPCSEVVIWIDFKQPILLSHRQVAAFRRMQSDHGRLTQNFRPIQPLSGRSIKFNVANDMSAASVPGCHFSRAACLSFALLLRALLRR